MDKPGNYFGLGQRPEDPGLSCGEAGVFLSGVPLLRKQASGFEARPALELDVLMKGAYGEIWDCDRLWAILGLAAQALNEHDLTRAMIFALHLQLPEPSELGAARLAHVDDLLAKYDPDQPRDWHGRWTTGAGDSPPPGPGGGGPKRRGSPFFTPLMPDPDDATPGPSNANSNVVHFDESLPQRPAGDWADPNRPSGGRLIPVQSGPDLEIGGNGPPEALDDGEPQPAPPEAEPETSPVPRLVPRGWDEPGRTENGFYYPPYRNPKFRDGTPWPRATDELVQAILAPKGRTTPSMTVYVPLDGIGPTIIGSTQDIEYEMPPGYDRVRLIGSPQVTFRGGARTNHSLDSVQEALRLAATDQFSEIYFNRSFSTITRQMVQSNIRPDVVGVMRPELGFEDIYHPYESLSPGQALRDRQLLMENLPGVAAVRGQRYKRYGLRGSPFFTYIGADAPAP